MKFTEEQNELLALLPTEIKKSDNITDSAKLVLANIYFLYGMDKAKENGFVYKDNKELMEETGIKSEHSIIKSVRLLENLGYIKSVRGKRGKSSEYYLLHKNNESAVIKCSNKLSPFETLQNEINTLQKMVLLLQNEVDILKKCSNKCSTDTESDKEKDKEYNTSSSTGTENFDDMDNDYVSTFDVDSYDLVKECMYFIPSDEVIENNSDELYKDSTDTNKSDTDSDIEDFYDKKENEMSDERNECNERNITSLPTAESDIKNLSPQPPSPYDWRETVHKLNKCREELNQCGTVEDFNVKLEEIGGILEIIKENDDKRSYERSVKNTIAFLNCTNIKNDFIFAAGDYRRKLENNLYKIA